MKRVAVLLFFVLGMNLAHADSKLEAAEHAKWQEECSNCHVAYPPQLLNAENWQKLMRSLNKHFGANAELNSKDNKQILDYLLRNAGSGKRYSSDSLRISETPWFKREHRSISPAEWTNPKVNSKSNCSACHGKGVLDI